MKSLQEQCREATKHIVLRDEEKAQMREGLVAYMQYKPIRGAVTLSEQKSNVSIFSFFRTHHFSGAFTIAGFVIGGTFGVTYVAEASLPGDLLYNVKVNINEELKSALLQTQESRIAWERERADRRLYEASKLASEGRLDDAKKNTVSKLLSQHTDAVVQQVREAETTDPILAFEQSSAFGESLDAHEAVLARLAIEQDSGVENKETRDLVEQVRTVTMELDKVREGMEEIMADEEEVVIAVATLEGDEEVQVTEETAVQVTQQKESANMRIRATERAKARAEVLLVEVEKKVQSLDADSDFTLYATAQVAFGKRMVAEGAEALSLYEYSKAYNAYRQAGTSFEKVRLIVEAKQLFSIEIYSEAEEESEGVVLEEKSKTLAELETLHQEIKVMVKDARTQLLLQTGHDVTFIEKINTQMKNAEARMLQGEIAMVLQDYSKAQTLLSTAHTHISRALDALQREMGKSEVIEIPIPVAEEEAEVTENVVSILHTYSDGVHIYSGTVDTPTPCTTIEQALLIEGTLLEQISIALTYTDPAPDVVCADVIAQKEFTATVTASEDATLKELTIEGVSRSWELNEKLAEESKEVEEEDKKTIGIFERAIDATQNLFTPLQ